MQAAVVFEPFRTVPLDKFLPELQFEFTDLPDPLFKWAILRAARDMARNGNLLRRRAVIHTQCGVTRYALRSPDGLEICGILGIRGMACCGDHIVKRSFDPPAQARQCGRERAWYDEQEGVLNLVSPYFPGEYFISMSVCPPDDACELPAAYYDDHVDILLTGARARILRMSNKPWTNLQLADAYEKHFNEGIADAAVDTHTHMMRGSVKMHFGRAL